MAQFLNTRTGSLTMGPAPMVHDVPIPGDEYAALLAFPPASRVAAAVLLKYRAHAAQALETANAAVAAYNAALDTHEDNMAALTALREAGIAASADGGEYPIEAVKAAEAAADTSGAALDAAKAAMEAANEAVKIAEAAVGVAEARLAG